MFQCKYCLTLLLELPVKGGCPRCGAPDPKELEPEVVRVVDTRYVHIPTPTGSYYTPRFVNNPVAAVRSQFFGMFGYKLASVILVLVVAILVASFIYWLNYRAAPLKTTDPAYQLSLPTALPTVISVQNTDPWRNENWFSAEDARNLRSKENVVNLAFLENGGAKYSADHSFIFQSRDPWKQTKPLSMTELSITGTSVQLKAGGHDYTLNVLQPFVLASQPTKVVVIDTDGVIWQADLSMLTIASINDVVSGLTVSLPPNPNLSFTY